MMSDAMPVQARHSTLSGLPAPPAAGLPVAPWWTAMLATVLILLFAVPTPMFPQDSLDGAWILAAERAVKTGAVFGRDFVFTYGPFVVLATGLFAAKSWIWVLISGVAIGLCWLAPLYHSRRPYLLLLYLLAIPVVILSFDARIVVAMLSGCLLAMMRPSGWSIVAAAGWGAIALSKLSFALVALPLMLLVDLHGVMIWRRVPLHTAALLAVFVIGITASGTTPGWWAEAIRNDGEIITAYSGTMQLVMQAGGAAAMLGMVAFLFATFGCFAWLAWNRPIQARTPIVDVTMLLLAIAWCLWMSFKMGFVRADGHMLITWSMLAMTIPAVLAVFELRTPLARRQQAAAVAAMLVVLVTTAGIGAKALTSPGHPTRAVVDDYITDLARRPATALAWFTPSGWRDAVGMRDVAERHLRRRFAWPAGTTADVIPRRLAPVIFSNLAYHPRPVPQSYSAYTPHLQALDARHFRSPRAPELLFLDVYSEIDERLPTLSLGPSLPVLARWYDVVGTDSTLGAVLRRRATPRPVRTASGSSQVLPWGHWLSLPPTGPGQLVGAAIDIPRGVVARMTGLLAREPVIFVELRRIDRRVDRYRLVPGMARTDVVISPAIRDPRFSVTRPDRAIGLLVPGSRPNATIPVTAIRLVGDPLAPHAYADPIVQLHSWTIGGESPR